MKDLAKDASTLCIFCHNMERKDRCTIINQSTVKKKVSTSKSRDCFGGKDIPIASRQGIFCGENELGTFLPPGKAEVSYSTPTTSFCPKHN